MAISIDWATKIISIPKADLTLVSGTLYSLDTDEFRLDLRALEASETGAAFDATHSHNTTYEISGVTYARALILENGYTVTIEDGQYRVRLDGSNNNILDVLNLNQVSVASQNSAGLIEVEAGEGGGGECLFEPCELTCGAEDGRYTQGDC